MSPLQTTDALNSHDAEILLLKQVRQHPELLQCIKDSDLSELKLQQTLRDDYPPELVRTALTLVSLRKKAVEKFSKAEEMFFNRQGLEQATPEAVASYKSQRFKTAPSAVYDLCSGIGSDSIAIASRGPQVISVDSSPLAGEYTMLNARAYGVEQKIRTETADVRGIDFSKNWVHIDPDRRAGVKRALRLEDYEPPLEFLQQLTEIAPAGAIKLSPASNFGGKFHDCEIELTSLNGECKEATVWFGEVAREYDWTATILPSQFTLSANPWEHYPRVGDLAAYVYDPDPAIVRAGLIDAFVEKFELLRLDDAEEYLTSDELLAHPAVTPFKVVAELSNNIKEIKKYFRRHPIGDIEIKCRHVPTNAEQLRKKIPLTGTGRATLLIARLQGKTKALVAERIITMGN